MTRRSCVLFGGLFALDIMSSARVRLWYLARCCLSLLMFVATPLCSSAWRPMPSVAIVAPVPPVHILPDDRPMHHYVSCVHRRRSKPNTSVNFSVPQKARARAADCLSEAAKSRALAAECLPVPYFWWLLAA